MECPSAHPIMRAESSTPAYRLPVLIFCPSTFSATCPGRGRTLFVLLAVLSAALRSVFAASQNPPHPHHGLKRAVFVFAGFLLLTGGTARAQGPVAADRAALVTLYNATGGANWTNNTNWSSNEALSEWHGVDTDATGRVTELHLCGNELSGEIPAELGNLTNLEELSLSSNGLSGPLPLTLSALSQLSVLDIRSTTLCAPLDTAFQVWLATINFQGTVCVAPPPPLPPPPQPPGPGGGGGGPRQTVPDAPINLMAEATDGAVTLSWDAPEDDGGFAITDYQYRINGRGSWISIDSTHTAHTVTGLDNGTAYVFQVRAINAAGNSAPSNRAEATPGVGALDFAHFANGAGIISDLVFVNVATHPIRPVLYFYGQEGHLMDPESMVDLTGDLEITEDGALSVRKELAHLGELTISTHGRGEVVSGSVRVAADGPIGGVLRFDLPGIGVAGVGASQPVRDALFPARRQAGGIATAAAIHNLGEEAMVVNCQLMKDGAVLEEEEIPLEANGQEARYIEQMFTRTDTSDFAGSVRCTAPPGEGMFTGVALELDAANQIFTTLPVVPVQR